MLKEPNPLREAGHDVLDAVKSYSRGDITRVITDGTSIIKTLTRDNESRERIRKAKTSPADVVQLSGSKNYETSADVFGPVINVVYIFSYFLVWVHRGYELGIP